MPGAEGQQIEIIKKKALSITPLGNFSEFAQNFNLRIPEGRSFGPHELHVHGESVLVSFP